MRQNIFKMTIFVWNSDYGYAKDLYSEDIRYKGLKVSSKYEMILKVMSFTGIDLFDEPTAKSRTTVRRMLGILVAMLMHISAVDYLIMSYINLGYHWEEYQVVISLVFSNTSSLALWHILYSRRTPLKALIKKMDSISDGIYSVSHSEKIVVNLAIGFCVVILPLTYSVVSANLMIGNKSCSYKAFYTYNRDMNNDSAIVLYVYFATKVLSTCLLDPIFVGCVTFTYCLLCHRSCRLLNGYRKRVVKLLRSRSEPSSACLSRLVSDYARISSVLERLQVVFSLPSFLMTLIDSMSSFTILASVLLYSSEGYTGPMIAENVFIFVTSAWLLIASIAFAARVPIAMLRIRSCLQRLQEKMLVSNRQKAYSSQLRLLQSIKERPIIVLSGCQIIYFTRVTILSALGTLFTYGLLIIQLK